MHTISHGGTIWPRFVSFTVTTVTFAARHSPAISPAMPPPESPPYDPAFSSLYCQGEEEEEKDDGKGCVGVDGSARGSVVVLGPSFLHSACSPSSSVGALEVQEAAPPLDLGEHPRRRPDPSLLPIDTGDRSILRTRAANFGARDGTFPDASSPDSPFRNIALCDRERESLQLRQALDRGCFGCRCDLPETSPSVVRASSRCNSQHSTSENGELVLVTGPSGCGKTCLVETVVHSALRHARNHGDKKNNGGSGDDDTSCDYGCGNTEPRGVLICGKFDQLERREQYYAIVQALAEYALILARESSPSRLRSVRAALAPHRETIRIVADLVPELQGLLFNDDSEEGSDPTINPQQEQQPPKARRGSNRSDNRNRNGTVSSPEGGMVARERLRLGLRRFFSAICSPTSSVVLFLDDLQWAEPASLDLLASLFTEPIPGLVVIGACRDNEVDPASYLCVVLRELEARHVTITQVIVSNVGRSALHSALSDAFPAGSDDASILAKILFEHTGGNMFFVTQLIRYLVSEDVLYKQRESVTWSFDSEEDIRNAIRAATDEVSLLATVIKKQEQEVQDTLMVASCLGADFSELVLKAAVTFNADQSLKVAEQMAFLKRSAHDPSTWRFAHDRIQESAYSLIPIHEREQVHLRIGRKLWSKLSARDFDVNAHVLLRQLRLGVRLITSPDERELLATLLLRAGEMAARASVHVTAQEYVSLGIQLLDARHWRDQYSLSLALYNAAAEIEYCLANFESMDDFLEEIMAHARSPKDKIRAQTARIYALGSRNDLDQAIDVGLATLRDFFGERLPSQPTSLSILVELKRTKRLLRAHSDESLMTLPTLDDPQTFASIRIMSLLLVYAVLCRPTLIPILAMRIVQHSIRRGLCGMSSTGFAFYGMVVATFFNSVELGVRYASIALRIVERFEATEELARASTVACGFCLSYTEPLPTLLQPLRLAHRVGLGSGDIEHSLKAAGWYTLVALYSSHPLPDLAVDVASFLALTATYRHSGTELMLRPLAQLIQCLRGEAVDPSEMNGTYLEWKPALRSAREDKNSAVAYLIVTCRLMLENLFRRGEDAEASANELSLRANGLETAPIFMKASAWLHQGLAHLALCHKDGFQIRRRVRRARKFHRRLVRLSRFSESNYGGKALLLGAELLAARGSHHQALLQYDAAIAASRSAEAWGDAGLACERLSAALQAKGRTSASLIYLNQASNCYELWGATAKVVELRSAILQKRDDLGPSAAAAGPKRPS
jgi:predicted ATPase